MTNGAQHPYAEQRLLFEERTPDHRKQERAQRLALALVAISLVSISWTDSGGLLRCCFCLIVVTESDEDETKTRNEDHREEADRQPKHTLFKDLSFLNFLQTLHSWISLTGDFVISPSTLF